MTDVTQANRGAREPTDQPRSADISAIICDSPQRLRYGRDRRAGHRPVELTGDAMMQSEIETDLSAPRSDVEEIINGAQSRDYRMATVGSHFIGHRHPCFDSWRTFPNRQCCYQTNELKPDQLLMGYHVRYIKYYVDAVGHGPA